jgi:hypothetical protein
MSKRHVLPGLILLAVFVAACAPTETSVRSPEIASATPVVLELTATPGYSDNLNSATPPPTVQAMATSRGPNLEAIDPTTVQLASGGVQFIEFFRFT